MFGNNNGGPCLPGWTLLGSQVWLLQVILADAPFVAIGLLGFALGTFFVIGGQIQRLVLLIDLERLGFGQRSVGRRVSGSRGQKVGGRPWRQHELEPDGERVHKRHRSS